MSMGILLHGALRPPHLLTWKITMYMNTLRALRNVLVDHGSLYPITPIDILQPTLGNVVLMEEIPSTIVLMEEIPSFKNPFTSLHL